MKTVKTYYYPGYFLSAVLLLAFAVLLPSCARKMNFQASSIVPAAEGSVKVKKDKNKNYDIDLKTIGLAPPSKLDPSKKIYIVWMDTEQNGTKKVGQLKTSSSLLSKTLKSSLKSAVPYNPASFFISAEDDPAVYEPSGQIVLSTK